MRFARLISILILPFAMSARAFAWDDYGHEMIAAIAWSKLTRQAKVQIAKLLNTGDQVTVRDQNTGQIHTLDFSIPKWSPNISDNALETTARNAFIHSAVWADAIKFGKSKNFDEFIDSYSSGSPGVESVASGERKRLRFWHYINLPIAGRDGKKHGYASANAIDAIGIARLSLSPVSYHQEIYEQKPMFLFLLVHIIGDLHQPLHCCTNYRVSKKGDAGGNRFQLAKGNLHRSWDNGIDFAASRERMQWDSDPSDIAKKWLNDKSNLPKTSDWKDLDPMHWAQEGRDIAIRDAYSIKEGSNPTDAYLAREADDCKRLALLGGYRLAATLNQIFGS